jgi:peptidylprolyl isomerase
MTTLIAVLALGQLPAPPDYRPTGPEIQFTMANGKSFVITTDPKSSPKTVAHIIALVKKGFYDRQRIHRVESWVTQWGAPASRNKPLNSEEVGDGGSGKDLPFEMAEVDFTRAVVGIASNGLQMGGDSQLFVLKKDTLRLYHSYAVVGKVTKGMETVDAIKRGDRIKAARVLATQRK